MASNRRITPHAALQDARGSCETEETALQTAFKGEYAKKEEMPQSTTGSGTQEGHLRCTKEGNEFVILPVSGCEMIDGVLRAQLAEHQDHLRFHVTDFDAYDGHYEVRASSSVTLPNPTQTEPWTALGAGEHVSPTLSRGTQAPASATVTVDMALVFEIHGPVATGGTTPAPKAATVKPPTKAKILGRLGDRELVSE